MKGRKIDTEFLSNFISDCVKAGIETPEGMASLAQSSISKIDDAIKLIEKQKVIRSKLMDVVSTFSKPIKDRSEDIKTLSFFQIKDHHICKFICDKIKNNTVSLDKIKNKDYTTEDILFCIKQLIDHKVVYKTDKFLLRGNSYDEFTKFMNENYK